MVCQWPSYSVPQSVELHSSTEVGSQDRHSSCHRVGRGGDDPAVRGERLETLATFLETVGVALDDPSWKHHGELETVFTEVERASADKSVPRRVRCLLQDVLDLRKEGWKSQRRKDLSKETPQTLAEVHEKAKADQAPSKKEITRSVSYR